MENENENIKEEAPVYDPLAPAPAKQRKSHPVMRTIALILVCILLGGAAGVGGTVYMHNYYAAQASPAAEAGRVAAMVEGVHETAIAETAPIESDKVLTASQVFAAT